MKMFRDILFLMLMGIAIAAQAMDQDVQVDLLMAKITNALKQNRVADALPAFAQLESMEPTLQNPLSEGFHFLYIDTLDKSGNHAKALSRANIYMEKFGKQGKYYDKVIEIMSRLQDQVEEETKIAALENKKKEQDYEARFFKQGGLTWMPQSQEDVIWSDANAFCTNTTMLGQTGWRLPTISELRALYSSGVPQRRGWVLGATWSSNPIGNGKYYEFDLGLGGEDTSDHGLGTQMTCVR